MNQATRLVLILLATALSCVASIDEACGEDRPNILWIIADDFSPELGCYGYEGVRTPNIDRLADQGVRYTSAFATAPVCSSSRSALITGVHQTTTGAHQHRTRTKPLLVKPIEPITQLMRRAGYFVCNGASSMKRPGKTDYNFKFEGEIFDGFDWAVRDKGRKKGQPFFAQVQIKEPHRDFFKAKDPDRAKGVAIPAYYPEHPVIRADWANYLASVEVLDRKVGVVLDRLDREGLADDTVVFFFGDHGRPHYRDKQWLYDGGTRVPLIVRWPRRIKPAIRDELVSLLDVSAATVALAGVEVPNWMHGRNLFDKGFAGREMVFASRDRCGSTLDRIRSVRTKRYKYIRNYHPDRPYSQHSGYKVLQYPALTAARVLKRQRKLTGAPAAFWAERRPAEELYDLTEDPEELNNLADDPAFAERLTTLRKELNAWIARTNDQGRRPEADEAAAVEASIQWFIGRMKKRGLSRDIQPEDYLRWWERKLGLK